MTRSGFGRETDEDDDGRVIEEEELYADSNRYFKICTDDMTFIARFLATDHNEALMQVFESLGFTKTINQEEDVKINSLMLIKDQEAAAKVDEGIAELRKMVRRV